MSADHPYENWRVTPSQDSRRIKASYLLCRTHVIPVEVWPHKVSQDSATVTSREEIQDDRVVVQLAVPECAGKLIDARVLHRSRYDQLSVTGDLEKCYFCSLQYLRIWNEAVVHMSLSTAFHLAAGGGVELITSHSHTSDNSLVPFLSALGLAVVYASRMPWV
jgi:hypothetical protein